MRITDTQLLRQAAHDRLQGRDALLHGGDISDQGIPVFWLEGDTEVRHASMP